MERAIEWYLAITALVIGASHFKGLKKGATKAQIAKLEKDLGVKLPPPYVESLQIHESQQEGTDIIPDSFGSFYLLGAKESVADWKVWNEVQDCGDFKNSKAKPDPGVANDWWNRGWIPFASNGGGDHLCLDLAPAKKGHVGQIIEVRHDRDTRRILAPDFATWLSQLADALARGELDESLE